jgi:hypothetical protein
MTDTLADEALVENVARAIRRSELGNLTDETMAQDVVDGSWTAAVMEARAAIAAMQDHITAREQAAGEYWYRQGREDQGQCNDEALQAARDKALLQALRKEVAE